jgi:hypothetical protein
MLLTCCLHAVTRCLHAVYTLFTRCLHAVYTLFTRCLHAVYTLFTRCLHAVYTPFFCYLIFTRCLHVFYFYFYRSRHLFRRICGQKIPFNTYSSPQNVHLLSTDHNSDQFRTFILLQQFQFCWSKYWLWGCHLDATSRSPTSLRYAIFL